MSPMSRNTAYSRPSRSRTPRREEQSDVIVIALTAQVILCIILLLAVVVMKKSNEERYSGVKEQYGVLLSDPAESQRAFTFLTDSESGVQKLFSTMENGISSLLARLFGEPIPEEPNGYEQEVTDDPAAEGDAPQSTLPTFDYDYLDPTDSSPDTAELGQGGAFPVSLTGQQMPENATMWPVALTGKLLPPVTGLITSDFAYRSHPVSGIPDFHTGMDIAAEEGREILAALPGEVVEVGESNIYGKYLILQHAINLRTFYGHCSEITATEGQAVQQGETIAKVGQTGVATGPHLHFSVIVEDQFTDPYWVLQDNIQLVEP